MLDDLRPAHVENELLAALGLLSARHADRPVRVGREQLAILADHLRLDPKPEPQAERLDRARQPVDPVGQLAAVDEPVAERGRVVVALSEPAVVEDEQLDPQFAGDGRHRQQPLGVEVEVRALPVVDLDRPRPVAPRPAGEPISEQAVERVAQAAHPVGGPADDRLGCRELLARLEGPAERFGIDADPRAGSPERFDLHLRDEVAGIDQGETDRLAVGLGRRRPTEGDERVVLVR